MKRESAGVQFWRSRKCYFNYKYRQGGRFSYIWLAKRDWAIYRLDRQRELDEQDGEDNHYDDTMLCLFVTLTSSELREI